MVGGSSDASTNSSIEILEMETQTIEDDKIAPIFEEEDDDDEEEDEDEEEEEVVEEEDDDEKDDLEFCGSSHKSTYSIKSSVSRYDKLLTLAAPKQAAATILLPTSKSFNDNSKIITTNRLEHKDKQLQEQQQVKKLAQRWRGKLKVNTTTATTSKHVVDDSGRHRKMRNNNQKNIVKRALLSLAASSSNSSNQVATRPKSTSSLKFGHNKLYFLTSGHKRNKTNYDEASVVTASINNDNDNDDGNEDAAMATITTTTTMPEEVSTTTTTTTTTTNIETATKTNLSNIIASLLRTTTL